MSQQGKPDQKKAGAVPAKPGAPRTTTSGSIPAAGAMEGASPMVSDSSMLTKHQKSALGSQFADSSAERRRNSLLATAMPAVGAVKPKTDEADEPTAVGMKFDGKEVPKVLQGRDVWIAVQAPLQSREGKRSRDLLENVIKQFGVTVNPRYDEDAPGKTRGHIFVWDVSRAMNCEIPHFVGAKELTLAQTCDWVRHEGPMRQWKRLTAGEAVEVANSGKLVIALPREMRTKQIAIVAPQGDSDDGYPRLMGIGLRRDLSVHPRDMFGSKPIDCFFHD